MTSRNAVHIRRVYEWPETSDGRRVLVDRVWPRALSKERAAIDAWFMDVVPTTNRKWFGPVTLVYGARDEVHNNAVVLAAYVSSKR